MPDINPLSPLQIFISQWLATNFKSWEVTDALTALAAEFDLVATDIIGTGVRVVQLQATKKLETDDEHYMYSSINGGFVITVIFFHIRALEQLLQLN